MLSYIASILLIATSFASSDISFTCASIPSDLSVDTITVDGTEYHVVSLEGFSLPTDGIEFPGLPSLPRISSTFLLQPDTRIESIEILSSTWESIPGKYYLYPAQSGLLSDIAFTPPDLSVYNSGLAFPVQPVEVSRQGSAMGYSVATLTGTAIKYLPADSALYVLTSLSLDVRTAPSESEQIIPNRETEWSAAMRERGIVSLVSNPVTITGYQQPMTVSFSDRTISLAVTESPSSEGDGVDMVIITGEELAGAFEQVAEYRTQQGIVTVVRTTEWINQFYSGADLPQKIRNFIRDAHIEWGIQAVLLGGDSEVVPVRECNGWDYIPGPFPTYLLPSDDYYADIDGNWSFNGSVWAAESSTNYIDLCLGRWPVNTNDDIDLMFTKLKIYEQPEEYPGDFARKVLLIGSNNPSGTGADDMIDLVTQLMKSAAIPEYLDDPTGLYYPHSLPGEGLCRNTAVNQFDQGYGLIIHADHSEIHKLATAGKGTLGQYMWDSDFSTMENTNRPSILWTLGCDTGHFDGAFSFSEAGLLTTSNTGLVAVIANSRGGLHAQIVTAYALFDALFNTGWISDQYGFQSLHWPVNYLGEASRSSKNLTNLSFIHMNLLGSPLMYVWRDDPEQLSISLPRVTLQEGIPSNVSVTVTDGSDPVENATVCLWKKDEVFSLLETNSMGQVTFQDVCVADGSDGQNVIITAVKRRTQLNQVETTVASYIPDQVELEILPASVPIIFLEEFTADAQGDGTANPGEELDIYLTAKNSGGDSAWDITAELTIVSGEEHVELIVDDHVSFPGMDPEQTGESSDPFTIVLNPNVANYSVIEFSVLFSYNSSFGILEWESPLFLTVYSEMYAIPLITPVADNSTGITAEIELSGMLLANIGHGEASDLTITVNNVFPVEPFEVNFLTYPSLESSETAELSGVINLTVTPATSRSNWLQTGFRDCRFDISVSSEGGDFLARQMSVQLIDELQTQVITEPTNLETTEVGRDFISIKWEHGGNVEAEGFYIYCDNGVDNYRVYPLPVPVEQITVTDLLPGEPCTIEVTAIDPIGRESRRSSISNYTTCPTVDGWPVQLEGSPGSGPVIADMDQDGTDEIIVAASFGVVYIMERSGSFEAVYPPVDFDFDRFLGCAVGDVDGDSQLEIVVACQRKIEVVDQEQVAILLYDDSGLGWTASEIATTQVNEELASPSIAGTPVLLQADNTTPLEIALRTRGSNGGIPHLYVWRYDSGTQSWVNFDDNFPTPAIGGFYNSPNAVDFDEDGLEELILTVYGTGGTGTALKIIDFQDNGVLTISVHGLSELDTEGEEARTFGTFAAAEQNGVYYITGVAKIDAMSGLVKKVFAYTLEPEPSVSVSFVWQTDWLTGSDAFGNMPGPAIGDLDGDNDLEVVYTLNGGKYNSEGLVFAWDLADGTEEFMSDSIRYNPIIGGGGSDIKSQPVIGLTSTAGSGEMVVFSGFASLLCGHDPQNGSAMIESFPGWTRDAAWGAPAICNLNGDGSAEILYIDYSGHASLYDWQDGSYTSEGWHMYQDNPHRNGFYNAGNGNDNSGFDLRISDNSSYSTRNTRNNSSFSILTEIEIAGSSNTRNSNNAEENPITTVSESQGIELTDNTGSLRVHENDITPDVSSRIESFTPASAPVNRQRSVEIAAFCRGNLLGSTMIGLVDGTHAVEIPMTSRVTGTVTVIVDPYNEYLETDETNNTAAAEETLLPGNTSSVLIPSPAGRIELKLDLLSALPQGLHVRVFSTDGRVVLNRNTEELQSGTTDILLSPNHRLPAGMYTVCVEGLDFEVTRKVIILNQ